jgi:hypothetical protein
MEPAVLFEDPLVSIDVASFWKKGYIIIPGFYSPEEVAFFREETMATRNPGGELLFRGGLRQILTDGRLVEVARTLLGVDEILYTGDSSATINSGHTGWHKDNADRLDPNAPDWASRYTQLRFGLYLQDHTQHSGGLNVREGSHDIPNLRGGKCIYLKVRPGDLAVWNMRITHSGHATLLKDPNAPFPTPTEAKEIPADQHAPMHEHRMAVFLHLGANDGHGHRYADYLKTRSYIVNNWRRQGYSDRDRADLKRAGITLRDMPAEVANDPTAGLKENWEPLPY